MQFFFAFLPYISSFPVILRFFRPLLFQPYHPFPSNSGGYADPLLPIFKMPRFHCGAPADGNRNTRIDAISFYKIMKNMV